MRFGTQLLRLCGKSLVTGCVRGVLSQHYVWIWVLRLLCCQLYYNVQCFHYYFIIVLLYDLSVQSPHWVSWRAKRHVVIIVQVPILQLNTQKNLHWSHTYRSNIAVLTFKQLHVLLQWSGADFLCCGFTSFQPASSHVGGFGRWQCIIAGETQTAVSHMDGVQRPQKS